MQTPIKFKGEVQTGVVYLAECRITGAAYVGLTMNFSKRKKEHLCCARNGSDALFHLALREYGGSNFDWRILHHALVDELEVLEKREIAERKLNVRLYPNGKGLNCSAGGQPGKKLKPLVSNRTDIIANFWERINNTKGEEQYWWGMMQNAFVTRAVPPGWSKTMWLKYGIIKCPGVVYDRSPWSELQNPFWHSGAARAIHNPPK